MLLLIKSLQRTKKKYLLIVLLTKWSIILKKFKIKEDASYSIYDESGISFGSGELVIFNFEHKCHSIFGDECCKYSTNGIRRNEFCGGIEETNKSFTIYSTNYPIQINTTLKYEGRNLIYVCPISNSKLPQFEYQCEYIQSTSYSNKK